MKERTLRLGRFLLLASLLAAIAACHAPPPAADPARQEKPHDFAAQGVILRIAPDRHQVTIHHRTIPGYMVEMTMDFPVKDPGELNGLLPGDTIDFTLWVGTDTDWVSHLIRTGHVDPATTDALFGTGDGTARLKPGDPLPDAKLVSETGRHFHLSDFWGKAVALTFFFTRCPLPTYCPLMNRNFSLTRQLLAADPGSPANWELLSISFDSQVDQPGVLSSYARPFRGNDAGRWLFAAAPPDALARLGPPLGLVVMRQGNGISHNLRTVVIDPRGRLFHQFNDNQWTPRQLADALQQAARLPTQR